MILLHSLKKLKDALLSTLPVLAVVLILYATQILTLTIVQLVVFLSSAVLVVIGMWLFNIGAETSMATMGEMVGSSITKKQKMWMLVLVFFLFGLFITIAEPDLTVLADQVPGIPSYILIVSVGIGVGIFIVIGALRILFQKSLKVWLLGFYALMFAVACLVDKSYIPLSMDSGGVTTGPITVPFILAVGIGIATTRGGNKTNSDSFGLVAFASIGPILTVMILSLIMRNNSLTYSFTPVTMSDDVTNASSYLDPFVHALLPRFEEAVMGTLLQVLISLAPIVVFFLVYNFVFLKLPARKILRTIDGVFYVYIGLVFFMTAVEAGFLPIGQTLGIQVSEKGEGFYWLLVLVGVILGMAAVFAEPAVHVLTSQVENVSDGNVSNTTVLLTLALSNGLAIALSILRIIYKIDLLYIVVPGYFVAFLLTFLVPDIYSAIAFDSGGVVSGPMNTTFIMPYAIGACFIIHGDEGIMNYAFGTVALVAMAPLISIQLLGLSASYKSYRMFKIARAHVREEFDEQIIHF